MLCWRCSRFCSVLMPIHLVCVCCYCYFLGFLGYLFGPMVKKYEYRQKTGIHSRGKKSITCTNTEHVCRKAIEHWLLKTKPLNNNNCCLLLGIYPSLCHPRMCISGTYTHEIEKHFQQWIFSLHFFLGKILFFAISLLLFWSLLVPNQTNHMH